ncbi:MAG: putative SbcD/Mre11-related phosphoesterase [Candidatus Nanohaloarchaea archaeon]|jgi:putative SbcD/Mre11-related phosphoesterase
MQIKEFSTVDSLPALYHRETSTVVISDLHLGLEGSMTQRGSYIPPEQLEDTLEEMEKIKKETEAEKLIVNGDLKTEFSTSRYSERQEIKKYLNKVTDLFEDVVFIQGNHDTFLSSILEEYGLRFLKYHVDNGILYTHGHISLEELDVKESYHTIVIGHEHPALRLTDEVGVSEKIDCFLYGDMKDGKSIIVMPAFSQISKGVNVNETPASDLLSPIMREKVDKDNLKAIGIDREAGTFEFPILGKF